MRTLLSAVVVLCALPTAAHAQSLDDEVRALRAAAAREAAGDLAGAETLLMSVLRANPVSQPGLLGLERVLQQQGRLPALVEPARRFLEREPASAIAYQVLLRTFDRLDRSEELERTAQAWIAADPRSPIPYREVAAVWRSRGYQERAIGTLERGRDAVGEAALALELGDAYAALGRYDATLREWDRAIGAGADGYARVKQRLLALPDGGMLLVPALLDRLTRAHPSPARRRAAVDLAIHMGMGYDAQAQATLLINDMDPAERRAFLTEVGRLADAAGLRPLAYWAYRELAAGSGVGDAPLVRARIAELALALGDTAVARATYRDIAASLQPGAPERRNAVALRIELLARDGDVVAADRAFWAFRDEFPQAQETDRLAAKVARAYLDRGDGESARRTLEGVDGPATGMLRGMLALADGKAEEARLAFMGAAEGLKGREATEALELAALLNRLSPSSTGRLAEIMSGTGVGSPGLAQAVLRLADEAPHADQPALLGYAASLAERQDDVAGAENARRRLVADYPAAPETPAALLALAESVGSNPDGTTEAVRLLERLILEHPDSPLLPRARQELSRLRAQVPGAAPPQGS